MPTSSTLAQLSSSLDDPVGLAIRLKDRRVKLLLLTHPEMGEWIVTFRAGMGWCFIWSSIILGTLFVIYAPEDASEITKLSLRVTFSCQFIAGAIMSGDKK